MGFEWDERKRLQNVEDHGVDFRDAARIFENPVLESEDDRGDHGEVRYRALGRIDDRFLVVVYTWRGTNRRLISAWKVGEHGRRRYQALLARRTAGDGGPG